MVRLAPMALRVGQPPGGGQPGAERVVRLTRPYFLGETEVSQALYAEVMGENPAATASPSAPGEGNGSCEAGGARPELPVVCVSWREAVRFANALSERHGLQPTYREVEGGFRWDPDADGFRLPTEAEWEAAARGGASDGQPFGDDAERSCRANRIRGFRLVSGLIRPCPGAEGVGPVGQGAPNAYGMRDAIGNVAEWVWDADGPLPEGASVNPSGALSGTQRVVRGGASDDPAEWATTWYRRALADDVRSLRVGLRLARNAPALPADPVNPGSTSAGGDMVPLSSPATP